MGPVNSALLTWSTTVAEATKKKKLRRLKMLDLYPNGYLMLDNQLCDKSFYFYFKNISQEK